MEQISGERAVMVINAFRVTRVSGLWTSAQSVDSLRNTKYAHEISHSHQFDILIISQLVQLLDIDEPRCIFVWRG